MNNIIPTNPISIILYIVAAFFVCAAVVLLFRLAILAAIICALFAFLFYCIAGDINRHGNTPSES